MAGVRNKEPRSLGSVLSSSSWSCLCPCGVHCFLLGVSNGSWKASPTSSLTVTGGPGNPELTFQEGGSHQPGTYSHSEDRLRILPPPGPLSCLFFVFLIFLFLPSIGTLPAEQGMGLFPAFSLCAPKWRPFSPSFNLLPSPHAHPMFLLEDLSLATAYLLQPLTFFFFSKAAPTSPPTPKALICSRIQYGL